MITKIEKLLQESIAAKKELLDRRQSKNIAKAANAIINCLKRKGKVILFGNGGSAADSQHIAAELVGRFKKERSALCAISLTTNTSILTAIGNDYGYERVFSRQIEAIGKRGDVVFCLSTSGNSKNVIVGIKKAKQLGLKTICLVGGTGGKLKSLANIAIVVPSKSTPRIQEVHITIGHIICELTENALTKN